MFSLTRIIFVGLLLLTAVLLTVSVYSLWPFTADDIYITLRYANHLDSGHGITWNIGEPPLEGYSNFTYLLLAAFLYHYSLPTILGIKIFSLLSFIINCIIMYRIMRFWVEPLTALLPVTLLIAYPPAIFWTVSGMETPFFQCLITGTVYYLLKGYFKTSANNRYFAFAGLLAAFASLTRPEGPFFFIVFAVGLLMTYRPNKSQDAPLIPYILSFLLIYLPYFIFRTAYFGRLFPNPVYCKLLNEQAPLALLTGYAVTMIPLLAASLPGAFKEHAVKFYYFLLPAILFSCLLYGVDPIVGYYNRYSMPCIGLLMMGAVLGIRYSLREGAKRFKEISVHTSVSWHGAFCLEERTDSDEGKYEGRMPASEKQNAPCQETSVYTMAITAAIGTILLLTTPSLSTLQASANTYERRTELRENVVQWFQQHLLPNEAIVIGDCGLIPLRLGTEIVDSLCLNSREMTRPPINRSYPAFTQWLLSHKKPAYIVLFRLKWQKQFWIQPFEDSIQHNQQFTQDYQLVKIFSLGEADYQYLIYRRI